MNNYLKYDEMHVSFSPVTSRPTYSPLPTKKEIQESKFALAIPLSLAICIIFVISGLYLKVFKEKYQKNAWCHESAISAIFGLIVGFFIKLFYGVSVSFDSKFFFYLVIPPIIFSAGYSLKRKRFFRYGLQITIFGIFGTILSVFLTTIAAHSYPYLTHINDSKTRLTWSQSLLLAVVSSASDEVSAMSLVRMKDYPRLGALIFGEGVLNDVVSIVLFKALLTYLDDNDNNDSAGHYIQMATQLSITVVVQFIVSLIIGLMCGLTCSRFLKIFKESRRHPVHQTSLILLFGFLSYSTAEFFDVSGILTLFVAAITLAHYSWHSLSRSSQISTKLSFHAISDIAEGFAFAYVGLSMWKYTSDYTSILFSLYMLVSIFAVRIVMIMGICYICGPCHPDFRLPIREQLGLCLGGIVRGCLCWAQVLQIEGDDLLITTTLFIVLTTTVGAVIMPALVPPPIKFNKNEKHVDFSDLRNNYKTSHHNMRDSMETDGGLETVATTLPLLERKNSYGSVKPTNLYKPHSFTRLPHLPIGSGYQQHHVHNSYITSSENSYMNSHYVPKTERENLSPNPFSDGGEGDDDNTLMSHDPPPHMNEENKNNTLHHHSQINGTSNDIVQEAQVTPRRVSSLFVLWIEFDEQIMKPLFGGSEQDEFRSQILSRRGSVTSLLGAASHRSTTSLSGGLTSRMDPISEDYPLIPSSTSLTVAAHRNSISVPLTVIEENDEEPDDLFEDTFEKQIAEEDAINEALEEQEKKEREKDRSSSIYNLRDINAISTGRHFLSSSLISNYSQSDILESGGEAGSGYLSPLSISSQNKKQNSSPSQQRLASKSDSLVSSIDITAEGDESALLSPLSPYESSEGAGSSRGYIRNKKPFSTNGPRLNTPTNSAIENAASSSNIIQKKPFSNFTNNTNLYLSSFSPVQIQQSNQIGNLPTVHETNSSSDSIDKLGSIGDITPAAGIIMSSSNDHLSNIHSSDNESPINDPSLTLKSPISSDDIKNNNPAVTGDVGASASVGVISISNNKKWFNIIPPVVNIQTKGFTDRIIRRMSKASKETNTNTTDNKNIPPK